MAEDTYSSEGPQCPYCGYQVTADEPFYYDEMRYVEDECGGCGKSFDVSVSHDVTWWCSRRDSDVSLAEDAQRLSGEAVAARADEGGIAR